MGIVFVGGNTGIVAGATSGNTTIALNAGLTGGIASAAAAGDLVIAAYATSSAGDRTLAITDGTTAYTLIDTELWADDTYDTNLRVCYKVMGSTPDAATTFGPTGNISDAGAMAVYVFRGVDATTPLDVAAVPSTILSTSRPDPPAITPVTAGAFIVGVGAAGHSGGTDTFTSADLLSFLTVGSNDSNDVTLGIGHFKWMPGKNDPAAFGHTQSDSISFSSAAMTIALRPAVPDTPSLIFDPFRHLLPLLVR